MVIREQPKLYTAEEFWDIASLPENEDKRLELDEGVIVEMTESRPINTIVTARTIYFLSGHVIPNDLGYVTTPDSGFKLWEKKVRQPDVAFIAKARVPKIPKRFNLPPDLAVEVVSPSEDVFKKVNEYLSAGVKLVWTVYPDEKTIYVFRKEADGELRARAYGVDDTLDGGEVLPGFTLKVGDVFP